MLVNIEDQIPCCAAISASVEPPFATITPQRPLRGNQHLVGILRIDPDLADVTRVFETHIFPRLTAIHRLINTGTRRHTALCIVLARTHPNRIAVIGV